MTADEFTHRRVWRLAGPIILSNVSVPLLSLIDTAVVGWLPGAEYVGAVAVGAMTFNVIYFGLGFIRMGTTGLTAQALGRRDADDVRATLVRACLFSLGLATLILVLQRPLGNFALDVMEASPAVRPHAETYIFGRIWGAPAALANYALLGWFIGVHNTRAALIHQVAMNSVNIGLDFLFVFGLGLGVGGVAFANVLSQVAALALGLWLVARELPRVGGRFRIDLIRDRAAFRRMVSVNRDIFLRSAFLLAAQVMFLAAGSRMGDAVLAANAVLFHFHHLAAWTLDAFAYAAEAMTGSAVGAGRRREFRAAVRATSQWAVALAVGFSLFFLVAGPWMIDLLTTVPEVRRDAREFLPWAIAMPVLAVWGFMLDGVFLGATRTAEMRNAMLLSVVLYFAVLWTGVPLWGNHGLWLAYIMLTVARALTLAALYPRIERAVGATP